MRGYTPLTRDERYQIYALRKAGHSQKEIAEVLRRNPSTISRELGRNKGLKGYRPEQAHRLAQNRKKERDRAIRLSRDRRSTRVTRTAPLGLPITVSASQSPMRLRALTTSGRSSMDTRSLICPRRS